MNTLVIGDIHGCFGELQALLDKAGLADGDVIISLGDFMDRGSESPEVLNFFRTHAQARAIQGNHERKHVSSFQGRVHPAISQLITTQQLGEEDYPQAVAWFDTLPRYLDLPEALLVHGFFEPGVPLAQQRETVLVGTMSGEGHLRKNYPWPWFETYDGPKPLIVAHQNYKNSTEPLICKDRVFGLDTGCCRGGALTGVLLPAFRIVSVPSRMNHWEQLRRKYAQLARTNANARRAKTLVREYFEGRLKGPDEALAWNVIDPILAAADTLEDLSPEHQEKIARLHALRTDGAKALDRVWEGIQETHAKNLARLREENTDFDAMTEAERGRAFAALIGRTPLSTLQHLLRKGLITRERLYAQVSTPREALRLANMIAS